MANSEGYKIVQLANGAHSVHSCAHRETFHPVVGPEAEAEALYIRQLRVPERMALQTGEFVVWDVGLGAAGNAVHLLRSAASQDAALRLVSFDHTSKPLEFALKHTDALSYLRGYETPLADLLRRHHAAFRQAQLQVQWDLQLADFPGLIASPQASTLPKPHAVMFDAFSPATNPAMWTLSLFENLFRLLDPARPCALPTYSRSTLLRVTLLLAGFYVGVGPAIGDKEETTIAANVRDLVAEPLDQTWLRRVHRSNSAEPLSEPVYRQAPLSPAAWDRLQAHPQFC